MRTMTGTRTRRRPRPQWCQPCLEIVITTSHSRYQLRRKVVAHDERGVGYCRSCAPHYLGGEAT